MIDKELIWAMLAEKTTKEDLMVRCHTHVCKDGVWKLVEEKKG